MDPPPPPAKIFRSLLGVGAFFAVQQDSIRMHLRSTAGRTCAARTGSGPRSPEPRLPPAPRKPPLPPPPALPAGYLWASGRLGAGDRGPAPTRRWRRLSHSAESSAPSVVRIMKRISHETIRAIQEKAQRSKQYTTKRKRFVRVKLHLVTVNA